MLSPKVKQKKKKWKFGGRKLKLGWNFVGMKLICLSMSNLFDTISTSSTIKMQSIKSIAWFVFGEWLFLKYFKMAFLTNCEDLECFLVTMWIVSKMTGREWTSDIFPPPAGGRLYTTFLKRAFGAIPYCSKNTMIVLW